MFESPSDLPESAHTQSFSGKVLLPPSYVPMEQIISNLRHGIRIVLPDTPHVFFDEVITHHVGLDNQSYLFRILATKFRNVRTQNGYSVTRHLTLPEWADVSDTDWEINQSEDSPEPQYQGRDPESLFWQQFSSSLVDRKLLEQLFWKRKQFFFHELKGSRVGWVSEQ